MIQLRVALLDLFVACIRSGKCCCLGLALEPGVAAALNPPELPALRRAHRAEMSPDVAFFRAPFRVPCTFLSGLNKVAPGFVEDIGVGVCWGWICLGFAAGC